MSFDNPRLSANIKEAVPILCELVLLYQNAKAKGREDTAIWADYAFTGPAADWKPIL